MGIPISKSTFDYSGLGLPSQVTRMDTITSNFLSACSTLVLTSSNLSAMESLMIDLKQKI
jgi:hypothetical protein